MEETRLPGQNPSHWQLSRMPQPGFKSTKWGETASSQWQCFRVRPLSYHDRPIPLQALWVEGDFADFYTYSFPPLLLSHHISPHNCHSWLGYRDTRTRQWAGKPRLEPRHTTFTLLVVKYSYTEHSPIFIYILLSLLETITLTNVLNENQRSIVNAIKL